MMQWYLISALLIACAQTNDDVQYVKSVKGGGGGNRYNPGANLVRYFGNETQYNQTLGFNSQQGYNTQQGNTQETYGQNSFYTQRGYDSQNVSQNQQTLYPQLPVNGYNNNQPGYNQPGTYPQYPTSQYPGQQNPGYNQPGNYQTTPYPGHQSSGTTQPGYNQQGTYPGSPQYPGNSRPNTYPGTPQYPGYTQPGYNQQGKTSVTQYPGTNNTQPGYNPFQHTTVDFNRPGYNNINGSNQYGPVASEIGVCYIEVPTVSLVKDPRHVPQGNGSRPDMSRIRTCCKGYVRNIYNYKICDPVCTKECVNSLCSAPDTCTCFPDHVKNLAGFCIATCPIGCQNGNCAGGECLCRNGYKLDADSKYCIPSCKDNCGGLGNCTAPNTCQCRTGYKSSPDGTCKPDCDRCENGDCVAPNQCQCHRGFTKDQQGHCKATCTNCINGDCVGANECRCHRGYAKDHLGACKPACDQCTNGECVGPNECRCDLGYSKDLHGTCKPACEQCTNGECVGPNECRCHSGFIKDQNGRCGVSCPTECGPNGCSAPNVCNSPAYGRPSTSPPYNPYNRPTQPDGYQYQQTNEQSQCSQPCINGICVEGNRCVCNPGYVLDREDPTGTKCLPNCPGGCLNGVCSGPNFCICNMGYYKDHSVKGHPTCVKRIRRSADLQP